MLRHVRDIRGPLANAQGKQPAKAANGTNGSLDSSQGSMRKIDKVASQPYTRDTRLHQTPSSALQPVRSVRGSNQEFDDDRSRIATDDSNDSRVTGNGPGHLDVHVLWSGVAYAIAIYPYFAAYDDEFDVSV